MLMGLFLRVTRIEWDIVVDSPCFQLVVVGGYSLALGVSLR